MECWACSVLSVFCVLIVTLIIYIKWKFRFFKVRRIPYPTPSIPWGNTGNIIKPELSLFEHITKHYNFFKAQGEKYCGITIRVFI